MNRVNKYIFIAMLLIASCSVKDNSILIEDDLLRSKLEEFERRGISEASFYIRKDYNRNAVLVVGNHNLGKCDVYESSGSYKSIQIQLFVDSQNLTKEYKSLFKFPKKTKCIQSNSNDLEIAPDSEMIYEYEITKNGLVKVGKW